MDKIVDIGGKPLIGYDPNEIPGAEPGQIKAMLPMLLDQGAAFIRNADFYIGEMTALAKAETPYWVAVAKAVEPVPKANSYLRTSLMPDVTGKHILEWPGLNPTALTKVADENTICNMIIQQRVLDVIRYSSLSSHHWRPGWRIEMASGPQQATDVIRKEMMEAEQFIMNCSMDKDLQTSNERAEAGLTDFQSYLAAIVRDRLRYDLMASWTTRDKADRVTSFAALPGGYIRFADRNGYNGKKEEYAVMVDETGQVVMPFTRDQLNTTVCNPRTDPNVGPYGYSEIQMTVEIIQSFQNALALNSNTFDKSGLPNGILLLKGDYWGQRQVDLLSRAWQNMKKGISKAWALPAISVPKDGDIDILDLNDLKGTDVRYKDHMNMMAGVFCLCWGFPMQRLGYHTSGHNKDNAPMPDQSTDLIGDDDPGLAPLLIGLERQINPILISRWPHLRFRFTGKNPKEDAREYAERKEANTQKERRARADLPSLEEVAPKGEDFKLLGQLMDMCPTDSNQITPFTALASIVMNARLGVKTGNEEKPPKGALTGEQKDPSQSEAHGGASGLRRDSAKEKGKT